LDDLISPPLTPETAGALMCGGLSTYVDDRIIGKIREGLIRAERSGRLHHT
jgi:hypothetical protein